MIPITHHTSLFNIDTLVKLDYSIIESTIQEALYQTIWKAQTQSSGVLDKEVVADEITIWVLRDRKTNWDTGKTICHEAEVKTYTGFVSEFQLTGRHGWQLWLSDGKEWIYHNDWDDTEFDQLLYVRINREQVEIDTD